MNELGTKENPHPNLPPLKERIKGHFYLDTKKRLSYWDGNRLKCEHNRKRNTCKECGGASICEHDRIRSQCKECGGASICEHDIEYLEKLLSNNSISYEENINKGNKVPSV